MAPDGVLFASMPPPSVVAARAAEVLAASHRETSADKQRRIAELEERARLFGDSVKQSAAKKKLERKWSRFMLVRGGKYGFMESRGPTVELVEHFTTYCFCTRDRVSTVGREGSGWRRPNQGDGGERSRRGPLIRGGRSPKSSGARSAKFLRSMSR